MKWFLIGLTILMLTGCFNPFKDPFHPDQDDAFFIQSTHQHIQQEAWNEAEQIQDKLQKSWSLIQNRTSLNASSSDLADLDIAFVQLETYIEQKEKTLALAEVKKLRKMWEEIARL